MNSFFSTFKLSCYFLLCERVQEDGGWPKVVGAVANMKLNNPLFLSYRITN